MTKRTTITQKHTGHSVVVDFGLGNVNGNIETVAHRIAKITYRIQDKDWIWSEIYTAYLPTNDARIVEVY